MRRAGLLDVKTDESLLREVVGDDVHRHPSPAEARAKELVLRGEIEDAPPPLAVDADLVVLAVALRSARTIWTCSRTTCPGIGPAMPRQRMGAGRDVQHRDPGERAALEPRRPLRNDGADPQRADAACHELGDGAERLGVQRERDGRVPVSKLAQRVNERGEREHVIHGDGQPRLDSVRDAEGARPQAIDLRDRRRAPRRPARPLPASASACGPTGRRAPYRAGARGWPRRSSRPTARAGASGPRPRSRRRPRRPGRGAADRGSAPRWNSAGSGSIGSGRLYTSNFHRFRRCQPALGSWRRQSR